MLKIKIKRFKDNIWAADLAEMGSLSSKNQGVKYLLCVTDVFTKYAWVKPLNIVGDRLRITDYKNILSKAHTKNPSIEILVIDLTLKTNP